MAILVLVQLILGFLSDAAERPLAGLLLDQHVRIGLLILALMTLRLSWRLAKSPPPYPAAPTKWRLAVATTVHIILYLLLFAMTISGYVLWAWIGRPLDWFGLVSIPILFAGGDDETWRSIAGYTHNYAAYVLIALIILHIVAALWHEFVERDRLISDRML